METPIDSTAEVGLRIRRMRLVKGLGQGELAEKAGISAGLMSHIENGRHVCPPEALTRMAQALDCGPGFLTAMSTRMPPTRPWLRAYADAPQKALDRHLGDATNVVDIIDELDLRRVPASVPVFDGDLADADAIEDFAGHVRSVAGVDEGAVIGHMIRFAERLGCVVLPMASELGRHMGLSTRFGSLPIVCVSRPSEVQEWHVPGDRQRLTVAHELGHLALHAGVAVPDRPEGIREIERQAFRFAAALLAPADAMYEELEEIGGRVTLTALSEIKSRWGVAIKMLVGRFRDMGVIVEEQARSLYKQISARGWNRGEPVYVGNEDAIWLRQSLAEIASGQGLGAAIDLASQRTQLHQSHFYRWVDWSPTKSEENAVSATVIPFRRGE
jgi:Zn-dependent peptidase ImmA (M78 family)/transcriptional regulator with XRE-family HTH domain